MANDVDKMVIGGVQYNLRDRRFVGTRAELDAAIEAGEIEDGTMLYLTDDVMNGETAAQVKYDNTESGLEATSVQSAIDENADKISQLNTNMSNLGKDWDLLGELIGTPSSSKKVTFDISEYRFICVVLRYALNYEQLFTIPVIPFENMNYIEVSYKSVIYGQVEATSSNGFTISSTSSLTSNWAISVCGIK